MEIIKREMTINLDIKDCEILISWYRSEFEMLLNWNVNEEWKEKQTAETVFKKISDNQNLVYQISKIPKHSMQTPIKKEDIIAKLIEIYWD